MRYILILFVLITNIYALDTKQFIINNNHITEKKRRFLVILLPIIEKVDKEIQKRYKRALYDIRNYKDFNYIKRLKKEYDVKSDNELLMALKPHPKSITLAQAALESAWATSRFFKEANNVFGIWSTNQNDSRIAASQTRGNKIVWLKKYNSLEDSVRAYYKLLAKNKAYKEFRKLKMKTDDVYKLGQKLNNYCELGDEYCIRIEKMIKYNKFTQYD